MEEQTSNFLSQGLRLVSNCTYCKKPNSTDPHVIEANDDMCLMHVTCWYCKHAILAVMNVEDLGVSCTGIMTDLSKSDTDFLFNGTEINIDDVLMTHEALSCEDFLVGFRQKN